MKITISYPPLESSKGIPLLTQNRQFQWFNNPTYIYPMVPAYAATLLQQQGYQVFWDDGIAEQLTYEQWLERLLNETPDLVAIETKTPVVHRHWQIIDDLKTRRPELCCVLMGDHVSALPQESFKNCRVDYILSGGDYDFSLLDLANHLRDKAAPEPMPPGIYYRHPDTGCAGTPGRHNQNLNKLPFIDRDLTGWQRYSEKNGNFKHLPGTYVMAGRDCWWGRCSFCSWTTLYPGTSYRTVTPERHLDEIGMLIKRGIREIFDDSGCFPKGDWLRRFCTGMVKRGYDKKVVMGCNMRVGALGAEEWALLKKANFRFILIGLESVNQQTLDRLNKGIQVEQVEQTLRLAKKAGLEPHITIMVGYPWETRADAQNTIAFARRMFIQGTINTLQATIVIPYPGTPLFEEARKKGWLLTEDWERYDMRESVWKSPVGTREVMAFTQDLYKAALNPSFLMRKLINIRSLDDIAFLQRAGRKVVGHLMDFSKNNTA
ncbi:MAG: radical SAM protein [bacterium]|nr:radical SAM protein [bacterium]